MSGHAPRHRAAAPPPSRAERNALRRSRRRRNRRGLALLGGVGFAAFAAVAAVAVWSTSGAGLGDADTDTVIAADDVVAAAVGPTVTLGWTAADAPGGQSLDGYYVTRWSGATPSPACGTTVGSPGTYLPASATGCTDASVPNGTYTYTTTAVFRTWSAESSSSNALVVNAEGTAPTLALTLASGSTNAYLSGTTLWFRPTVAGSARFALAVTDSGSGPASATFPAVATTGWTHAAETVPTGTGSFPTITYTSSPFAWTGSPSTPGSRTISGNDAFGNSSTLPVSFSPDSTAPTGGAVTVNAVAATAVGSSSLNRTGSFTIASRTDYSTDTGSGLSSSVLVRESASLVNGTCGTYGSATTVTGTTAQSGLTTACYRYTLTGTDRVGNTASVSTTVKVDLVVPTQAFSLVSPVNAMIVGTRVYFHGAVAGSFTLAVAATDAESGPASVTVPAIGTTGWTHNAETVTTGTGTPPTVSYPSSLFSWTAGASQPASKNIVSTDVAGNTVTTALAFTRDNTAPAGGALTVNAVAATQAGSTSNNAAGSFAVGVRTDWTETQSTSAAGLASSVLTREDGVLSGGACGGYGTPTVLAGAPTEAGLATGCYRYTLTGTDNVGNSVVRITTVRVDTSAPVGGALVVNGTAATAGGTTSSSASTTVAIVRTDWTDPEWATTTSTLSRQTAAIANGACGTFGASSTVATGTTSQTLIARNCYRYTLTGTNTSTLASAISTTVIVGPYVTSAQLLNGGGVAGRVTQGDQVVITFAGDLNTATMCSAWSGAGSQSMTADNQVTVTLTNGGTSDSVSVSSTLCTLNVGSISLGSTAYTAATTTFKGAGASKSTLVWDAPTRTLTITLGAASGPSPATVASSAAVYTPSTAVQNPSGVALGGTFTTGTIQQF